MLSALSGVVLRALGGGGGIKEPVPAPAPAENSCPKGAVWQPPPLRPRGRDCLPEIDYPTTLIVKNTFIDGEVQRQASLDGFYQERVICSCPNSAIDMGAGGAEDMVPQPELLLSRKVPSGRLAPLPEASAADAEAGATDGSRSTSAGSSRRSLGRSASPPPVEVTEATAEPAYVRLCPGRRAGLPELEYPSPWRVKNTFIDTSIGRPVSLDGYYAERQLRSCPVSGIGAFPGSGAEGVDSTRPVTLAALGAGAVAAAIAARAASDLAESESPGAGDAVAADASAEKLPMGIPPPPFEPPSFSAAHLPFVPPPPQAPIGVLPATHVACPPRPVILMLSEVVQPALGSFELPTVGSESHRLGDCKPCAHVHSAKGCKNGVECQFCHLCPRGELKRRQKEKRLTKRGPSCDSSYGPALLAYC